MAWIKEQWDDYKYNVMHGNTKGFYRMATVLVVLIVLGVVGTIIASLVTGVSPFQFFNLFS